MSIDGRSRYQLIQLRLANVGHSPAHSIAVRWKNAPTLRDGSAVQLGPEGRLPTLGPGEKATRLIDVSHEFFTRHNPATFHGAVSYVNASGEAATREFVVSAEHLREAMIHDEESPRTEYELQKIPDKLEKIVAELKRLGKNDQTDSEHRQP